MERRRRKALNKEANSSDEDGSVDDEAATDPEKEVQEERVLVEPSTGSDESFEKSVKGRQIRANENETIDRTSK